MIGGLGEHPQPDVVSRDGKRLAFCSVRAGKWEVWEKLLPDGEEVPILADNYKRNMPSGLPMVSA